MDFIKIPSGEITNGELLEFIKKERKNNSFYRSLNLKDVKLL